RRPPTRRRSRWPGRSTGSRGTFCPPPRLRRSGDTAGVIDLPEAHVFAVPLHDRFRGVTVREGVLFRGPAGWAEFAPFRDYDDAACVPWLRAALDSATRAWPTPVRDRVEVNATVPVVSPERAAQIVLAAGCRTAKVKVAGPGTTP